jgi:hypothetical protein
LDVCPIISAAEVFGFLSKSRDKLLNRRMKRNGTEKGRGEFNDMLHILYKTCFSQHKAGENEVMPSSDTFETLQRNKSYPTMWNIVLIKKAA